MKLADFLNEASAVYVSQERLRCCYNCKYFNEKKNWKFICDHVDFKGVEINPAGLCVKFTKI